MIFENNKSIENFGERVGYIFAYFLFTTILFLLLALLHKIPSSWNYLHVMIITLAIASAGIIFQRLLK